MTLFIGGPLDGQRKQLRDKLAPYAVYERMNEPFSLAPPTELELLPPAAKSVYYPHVLSNGEWVMVRDNFTPDMILNRLLQYYSPPKATP